MQRIWAPWRSEYIGSEKSDICPFCHASENGSAAHLLYSGSLSTVLLNKYPYTGGHLLISPLRHIALLEDLNPEESIDLFRLMRASVATLKSAFSPDGFNIGMNLGKSAGAGIEDHLHVHVVPRWDGDTNFMPVLSETRVLSEHLDETCEKLKPIFDRLRIK
ncbi:MAG: HIT domain-containing protein [Thermodesulfobacteriota bacterium]